MSQLKFYDQVCTELDQVICKEYSFDALEGLNSNILGRLFVSIADTFSGLLKTFGSNIARCGMALKRSELNEFVMSNGLKTRTVDRLPYDKCLSVEVDIPANMKGTYKASVNALTQAYARLNALNNSKLADTSFREALTSINTKDPKLSKQLESTALIIGRVVSAAKPSIDLCLTQFEGKFLYKVPFGKAFLSTQEWIDVRKQLLENEPRLQDVKPLTDLVASMEGTLKAITEAADANDTPVTPNDLRHLSDTAKGVALILDAYGMATTRQMALEHNYVLCINNLYNTVK